MLFPTCSVLPSQPAFIYHRARGPAAPSHINKLLEHPHEVEHDNLDKKIVQSFSVVSPKHWEATPGGICEGGCVGHARFAIHKNNAKT